MLPKDVADHCGATFHEVKIFLFQKFVVYMPVSYSQQMPMHSSQGIMEVFKIYVTISRRDVYYGYLLCSVILTDL